MTQSEFETRVVESLERLSDCINKLSLVLILKEKENDDSNSESKAKGEK